MTEPGGKDRGAGRDLPAGRNQPTARERTGGQEGGTANDQFRGQDRSGGQGRSGLRNPPGAVRGLGAGTLFLEAVVLLLAIQPLRVLGDGLGGPAILAVGGLAGAALVLAALIRRSWAWRAGGVLQVLLLLAGLLHWSLAVLGAVFGAVWLYVLHVRRVILN